MGRGRAKAKQAKVARQLKYAGAGSTDLDALRRELAGDSVSSSSSDAVELDGVEFDDELEEFDDDGYDDGYPASDPDDADGPEKHAG